MCWIFVFGVFVLIFSLNMLWWCVLSMCLVLVMLVVVLFDVSVYVIGR